MAVAVAIEGGLFTPVLKDADQKSLSALSAEMSALEIERAALAAFLRFAAEHKEIYRIIDEAEFVDPASYRQHYETIAARIADRLRAGAAAGAAAPA